MRDKKRTCLSGDPYYCSQVIAEGLEKADQNNIESGLSEAFDLFVDYVLEDRHDNLMSLGRDLNAAYFPHRSKATEPPGRIISYLGQIRALINLCDYVTQRLVPENLWQVVSRSKYAKPIMQALQKNGAMLATELCDHADLPHPTQLQRTVQPLIDEGLLRREKFGKNVWYSLTSTGRLMTSRYFGIEDTNILDSVFPMMLSKLTTGWQNLKDLTDDVSVNLPIATIRTFIISILSALLKAGMAEEEDGNWRIPSRLSKEERELVDVSKYPDLISAARLIEKEYERLRIGGVYDKQPIDKARNILDDISTEVMTEKTERQALQVRVILERAKCSALDGNWRTTLSLVGEAEAIAQTHDIDAGLVDDEIRSIWSYVEVASLEPQLVQVHNYIERGDYRQTVDVLLTIYHLLHSSRRWNSGASLAIRLLRVALDTTRVFKESQPEYASIMVEPSVEGRQEEYEEEQAEECFRRWKPAEKFEYRTSPTPALIR